MACSGWPASHPFCLAGLVCGRTVQRDFGAWGYGHGAAMGVGLPRPAGCHDWQLGWHAWHLRLVYTVRVVRACAAAWVVEAHLTRVLCSWESWLGVGHPV